MGVLELLIKEFPPTKQTPVRDFLPEFPAIQPYQVSCTDSIVNTAIELTDQIHISACLT